MDIRKTGAAQQLPARTAEYNFNRGNFIQEKRGGFCQSGSNRNANKGKNMGHQIYAWTNLSLAMIIVGSATVFGKVITCNFPVFLASGIRFAIAAALIVPIAARAEKNLFRLKRPEGIRVAVMAFSGQFVFTLLMLLGLRYTSAIEAGIITSTSPAMMTLIAWIMLGERPGGRQVLAVILVVLGILCITWAPGSPVAGPGAGRLAGNLMILGAVAGEAVFLLMRRRISESVSDLGLTARLCLAGFFLFLPFSLYQAADFDFGAVPAGAWWSMVYFGAVFTVLAYLFWFAGVARVSGAVAGAFTAVMPVTAVVLSCIFLGESFTRAHAGGMALVLAAIVLMASSSEPAAAAPVDAG